MTTEEWASITKTEKCGVCFSCFEQLMHSADIHIHVSVKYGSTLLTKVNQAMILCKK